jgi:hypothetical protein
MATHATFRLDPVALHRERRLALRNYWFQANHGGGR